MEPVYKLLAVALLVAVNALFVAAELSLVAVKPTRIEFLASQGNRRARLVQRALKDPNRFISAAQVGITLAGLGLGWLAEPAIADLVNPLFDRLFGEDFFISPRLISVVLAFLFVTIVLIVLGELVPKMIALQRSEQTILATAGAVNVMAIIFAPIISMLYWLTKRTLDLLGLEWSGEQSLVYTEDELKMLVTASRSKGYLEQSEQEMIERAFSFHDVDADEVMAPRTEMIAIPSDASFDDVLRLAADNSHSRYPVYGRDLDDIVGVLNVNDLFRVMQESDTAQFNLKDLTRPALAVSEHTALDELLAEMKRHRSHLAIVADEHGGTAGLVTLGDLLERIVGDVEDEGDVGPHDFEELAGGGYRVNGLMGIDEVKERLGVEIDEPYYNTIAGYLFGQLGQRPSIGDEIFRNGVGYRVSALDGLRIDRVDVLPARSRQTSELETTEDE